MAKTGFHSMVVTTESSASSQTKTTTNASTDSTTPPAPQNHPSIPNNGYGNSNDDRNTWSKSKKKRMRQKQKRMMEMGKMSLRGEGSEGNYHHCSESTDDSPPLSKRQQTKPPSSSPPKSDKAHTGIIDGTEGLDSSREKKKKRKKSRHSLADSAPNTFLDIIGHENPTSPTVATAETKADEVLKVPDANNHAKKKKKRKKNSPSESKISLQKGRDDESNNASDDGITNTPNGSQCSTHSISLPPSSKPPMSTLQKSFLERLTSSRFRELNEELYTHSSQHSFQQFTSNPVLFEQYHLGFRKQVREWPMNPLDVIFNKIVNYWKKDRQNSNLRERKKIVIADFGCGDAKLAERLLAVLCTDESSNGTKSESSKKKNKQRSVSNVSSWCPFEIHSFDLVSGGNPLVTPADMSNVPLSNESIDVAVYCLALMGTNVADFVREAWRVLKFGGIIRIAEVRSRFETATAASGGENDESRKGSKLKTGQEFQHCVSKFAAKNKTTNEMDGGVRPIMLIDEFILLMKRCGFQQTNLERSNKMFVFMDFIKIDGSKGLSEKEKFSAKPCIYKRR